LQYNKELLHLKFLEISQKSLVPVKMCVKRPIPAYKSPEEVLREICPPPPLPPSENLLIGYISSLMNHPANSEILRSIIMKKNISTCFFQANVGINGNTRYPDGRLTFWVWMTNTNKEELSLSHVMSIETFADAVVETRRYRDRSLEIGCHYEGERFWVGVGTVYTHGDEPLGDDEIRGPGIEQSVRNLFRNGGILTEIELILRH
jgi:hypothetical protein